jgi:phage gp36-like protein
MPYATVADLQDRLGEARLVQLTDLADPPIGLVDQAVAQKALDDADAEIDGYLVGRYALPLTPAPGVLKVHAVTIAHYRLLGSAADDGMREDYKAVRQWLQAVAEGRIVITPPQQAAQPTGAGSVLFSAGSKVMGRDAEAEA